jgi:hypothetical protein
LVSALLSIPYGIIVFWITHSLNKGLSYPTTDKLSNDILHIEEAWFTLSGGVIAAICLVGWSTALSRALPLHYTPLLRWHPSAGILFLISTFFLLIPMVSDTVLSYSFMDPWGTLETGGDLICCHIGLLLVMTGLSLWTTFIVIGRLGDLLDAIWSLIALASYITVFMILFFAVLRLGSIDVIFPFAIYTGFCVASLWMSKRVRNRWFRVLVFYPSFLVSSPLFFFLFSQMRINGASVLDRKTSSLATLLLTVLASVLVSSVFSWKLRLQPARLAG